MRHRKAGDDPRLRREALTNLARAMRAITNTKLNNILIWKDGHVSAETITKELERRGFKEREIEKLQVGDEIAYFETLFGFNLNSIIHEAKVWRIEQGQGMEDYKFKVIHSDGETEAEEGDVLWARSP